MPQRVRMTRHVPWRADHPDAVRVDRATKWGNPYRVGHTQLRFPTVDGREEWEHEGRLYKTSGERHPFFHGDSTVTWHDVRDATVEECVALYREMVTGEIRMLDFPHRSIVDEIRAELAGKDLACWCKLGTPCHADVLLKIAAGEDL